MIDVFSIEFTVSRFDADGKYVLGKYHAGTERSFTVLGTIQPMDAKSMLLLPEGERTKETIRIYTGTELMTVDLKTGRKADVVTYRFREYEVHSVKFWESLIPHFQIIAVQRNKKDGD